MALPVFDPQELPASEQEKAHALLATLGPPERYQYPMWIWSDDSFVIDPNPPLAALEDDEETNFLYVQPQSFHTRLMVGIVIGVATALLLKLARI